MCWTKSISVHEITPSRRITTTLAIQGRCMLCKQNSESEFHLFYPCHYSAALFHLVMNWIGITGLGTNLKRILKWSYEGNRRRKWKTKWLRSALTATVYFLWHERTMRLFNDEEKDPNGLF